MNNFNKIFSSSVKILLILIIIFFICPLHSINSQSCYHPFVESVISNVNPGNLALYIRVLSGDTTSTIDGQIYRILTRYHNSTGNEKASHYIYERFREFGLNTRYQVYSSTGTNVIGIKPGVKYPNRQLIICGHYDAITFASQDTVPGADDNASGVSGVIEAARVLSQYDLDYTVVFIAFDEEEVAGCGSCNYVDSAFAAGDSIKSVINLDMIGYDSNNDSKFDINTDTNSYSHAIVLSSACNVYQPALVPRFYWNERSSDYRSFWDKGYKAIGSVESHSDFNRYYHTIDDKFIHLKIEYITKIVKTAIAYLLIKDKDYIMNFEHQPLSNTADTGSRIAKVIIRSGHRIAAGYNSPRLYYRSGAGSFVSLNSFYHNLDTFRFIIPGQPVRSTVEYYFSAQDSACTIAGSLPPGARGLNPPGLLAPNELFSYVVFDRLSNCSNTVPRLLPSRIITLDSIFIDQHGMVLDLDINLSINHTNDSDLHIWLNRNGLPLNLLSKQNGGDGDNYINTTFDDEAELSIVEGSPPFTGIFRPEMELSQFDNSELHGLWKLRILNLSSVVQGELVNWCINFQYFDPIAVNNNQVPVSIKLKQNYPNPFNSSTSINYSLGRQSDVKISVFDVLGREVKILVNKRLHAGEYVLNFNSNDMASGLYFYSMFVDGNLYETKRMMLIK